MASEREFEPGTPSWVDLGSSDIDGAAMFYGGLFGWQATSPAPDEATGGYRMFQLGGKDVAGLGPQMGPATYWATYVSVADADATAKVVEANGGTTMLAPMDVMDAGRMAVFADTQGAPVSVWQPNQHRGAQVVNEPGSLSWSELNVRDIESAKSFYGAVFGWTADTHPMGETSSYTEWFLPGAERAVGGMIQMNEQWPEDVPAHWMVYFAVEDTDASAAKAEELGGKISVRPFDTPAGRCAVLNDPYGAVFSIITLSQRSHG